ncbi:MAG: tRNA-dihydrouridine synthase family protein [Lentisphaerae bacterium]|nr:tRNA-dihydrouridine synthase family protein [Lentisphaerota bacterium]
MVSDPQADLEWLLAPLAGYTDVPFRRSCRRCGCRRAFTPLIDACALIYGNRHNAEILARDASEPWLGVQLLGSDPAQLREAAERLQAMPFDQIDLNLGCPVRKVTQKGAGAALALDAERALRCVEAVRRASGGRPLSVKMRILAEGDPEPTVALAQRLAAAGVEALTVHGRVMQRVYAGPVWAGIIAAVRAAVPIPVAANGGIFSRADGLRLAAATGCRHLMVARGAIGNPWLFRDLAGLPGAVPSHGEVCEELREHLAGMVALYGEGPGLREGRKIILGYLCGRGYPRALRSSVNLVSTWDEFMALWRQVQAALPLETPVPMGPRPGLVLAELRPAAGTGLG